MMFINIDIKFAAFYTCNIKKNFHKNQQICSCKAIIFLFKKLFFLTNNDKILIIFGIKHKSKIK